MAAAEEALDAQLTRLGRKFEAAGDGTYLVSMGAGRPPAALRVVPPVIVFRVQIGELLRGTDTTRENALLRRLLTLNASGLLHAGYGLEGNEIVLGAALEVQNMDLNELDAVLSDLDLALTEHVGELRALATQGT
jgi:hypothetical protein